MSRSRIRCLGITVAVLVLLAAAPLGAQSLTGTVTDDTGAALAGVAVSLSGGHLPAALSRRTDAGGSYRFGALPPGVYDLELRHEGYAPASRNGVNVAAGAAAVEDVTLQPVKQYSVALAVGSGTTSKITGQATVSASTPEANPGDESAAEETTVTTQADLTIASSDSVDPVIAGTPLTYTVTVTNHGPSHARYVEVTDTLPGGVAFISTSGCAEDPAGVPLCTLGEIAAGDTKGFTTTVRVGSAATGVISNQVSVSSQTKEVKPGDESTAEDTAVDSRADLAVRVADALDPVTAGTPLSYTVTVSNAGPSDARDVVLSGTPPAGTTVVSSSGCADDSPQAAACGLGTIPAGASKQVTFALAVDSGATGVLAYEGSVSSQTAEAKSGDESQVEETTVAAVADLVITETGSAEPVIAGTPLTYAVTVSNLGPSDAREVVVTGVLPAGATLDSTAGCAEDPAGFPTCSLGTIAAGAASKVRVTLAVAAAATGVIDTRSSVTSATAEASPGGESATRKTAVDTRADLVVTSTDSVDPVVAGLPLTYTVTAANRGPSDARDVVVRSSLPAGVMLQSTAGCAEDGEPGRGIPRCSLGTIAAGSSKQLTIEVMVDPGATGVLSNQATATSSTTEGRPGDESTTDKPAGFAAPSEGR